MTTNHFIAAFVFAALAGCAHANDASSTSDTALTSANDNADAGPADAGTEPELFTWPVPDHWAPETDPFPLSFAPALPYASGVLELRFPSGFFTPTADTYFSYNYVWQLDGVEGFSAESLSKDLATYYSGLAQSADPTHFDASVHTAAIAADGSGHARQQHFRGTIHTVDGFNNSAPLELHADVMTDFCGGKFVSLFTMSPHPFDDATYTAMLAQRATFQCAE